MDADHIFKAALGDLLTSMVKVALATDAPQAPGWRAEAVAARQRAAEAAAAGDRTAIRLGDVWDAAVTRAGRDPAVRRGETVNPALPASCPFGLDELATGALDLDRAVDTIRGTASFG